MQLIEIDKKRYRKHLNIIIVSFIVSLLILSLVFGAVLISMFSTVGEVQAVVDVNTIEPETNFRYNLLGVILALMANAALLHSFKKHPFFKEASYVWQVKQIQNLIYRKLNKIKQAAENGEEDALVILSFYYQSQIQVYELDDNTITLSSIKTAQSKLAASIEELGLSVSSDQFDKKLIALY